MKTALGMIFKNEQQMLTRHLWKVSKPFYGSIFLDDNSTDKSVEIIKMGGCQSMFKIIDNQQKNLTFAEKRNLIIREAEILGCDSIVMLDADEAMFRKDIKAIIKMLKTTEAIALPRYEFGWDSNHYDPSLYPDYQGRAFQLNKGYHYQGNLHEVLFKGDSQKSVFEEDGFCKATKETIFHYGRCKTKQEIWERYHRYQQILDGVEVTDEKAPEDVSVDNLWQNVVEFKGRQPE